MEDNKRPCIQRSASLSPPSSSSSISSETHEAKELKDASVGAGSLPPRTLERTSDENQNKEQDSKCSSSNTDESTNEKKPLLTLHGGLQGAVGGGGGASAFEGSSTTLVHGDCGRERLKRHRIEMAGRVWIPDMWGQEDLLKDWIDCSAFDAALVSNKIMSARSALIGEGRRANSTGLSVGNSC